MITGVYTRQRVICLEYTVIGHFASGIHHRIIFFFEETTFLRTSLTTLPSSSYRSLSFESIMEDIEASLDVKRTPVTHSRKAVLEWIIKSIPKAKDMPTNKSELSAGMVLHNL